MATFFWGGTFVIAKTVGASIGEVEAAAWRFLISALLLTPLLLQSPLQRPTMREIGIFFLLGLSGVYLYNLFFFHGLQQIEASHAGLIIAINPAVILLLSVIFLQERLDWQMAVGIACSMCGAVVIVLGRESAESVSATGLGGALLILGCVVSWAIYSVAGKLMMKRYTPGQLIAISVWIGAVMLLGHLYVMGGSLPPLRGRDLLDILYLAILATVLAFIWFYAAIDRLGAAVAGQFVNLVPLTAVFLGYLVFDERLSWLIILGGCMVFSGVVMTQRAKYRASIKQ